MKISIPLSESTDPNMLAEGICHKVGAYFYRRANAMKKYENEDTTFSISPSMKKGKSGKIAVAKNFTTYVGYNHDIPVTWSYIIKVGTNLTHKKAASDLVLDILKKCEDLLKDEETTVKQSSTGDSVSATVSNGRIVTVQAGFGTNWCWVGVKVSKKN